VGTVNGYLDDIPLVDIRRFQEEWLQLLNNASPEIERRIVETGEFTAETEERLRASLEQFKALFVTTGRPETMGPERVVPSTDDQDERLSRTIVDTS
jgi:hypothetical protein